MILFFVVYKTKVINMRNAMWVGGGITGMGEIPMLGVKENLSGKLIRSLFTSNEQGFWYDPNDLSTLYQDSSGTVPVTAAGQPVGLILDKSKRMETGSNVSTGFTSGFLTVNSVAESLTNSIPGVISSNWFPVTPSAFYKIHAPVSNRCRVQVKNASGVIKYLSDYSSETSADTRLIPALADSVFMRVYFANETIGNQVTTFEVRKLSGNHAYQATSASRPLLKNIPYFLEYDNVDDSLSVNVASKLTNCTVVTSTRDNPVSIQKGQTIEAGALSIKPERAYIVINRELTSLETELITQYLKRQLTVSVVKESGGLQTVLYTAKGQPTYMNIIKKFDMSTINPSLSGTHPAFIVNGVEKPEIFIGTYQGRIIDGELLSLPNVEPTHSTNYTNFLTAARANGNGHHPITNAEWSAVALQCFKDNKQPMGNTYYGRSSENPLLIGRRADGLNPGDTSGFARTLTGSGPVEWRHNGKENGIADLSGNVWEQNNGLRLVNGEIQVIADNNAALHTLDMGESSVQWKAINGETGNLVTPDGNGTTIGTIKYANGGTADYTINGSIFGGIRNLSTTKPVTAVALARLKALCLYPIVEDTALFNGDFFNKTLTGETLPIRGGLWSSGAIAGVFALQLNNARTFSHPSHGSRPAFVNL